MDSPIDDFFNLLIDHDKQYQNFQPMSIFNSAKTMFSGYEEMILDFFSYLFTRNIVRIGLNFNNPEMPFMTFTKYGKTLASNEGRKVAFFEEFLNLYNSS